MGGPSIGLGEPGDCLHHPFGEIQTIYILRRLNVTVLMKIKIR
jgi:hypothetical protein